MGFWSSVGSFVSGAVSAVSSVVSSVANFAGSALGSVISKSLAVVLPVLSPWMKIVQAVGVALGIVKPDERPEELGAKAMASEKTPENFESNAAYIQHLRDNIKLDKDKFDRATSAEKVAYKVTGTTIIMNGVSEEKGFDIPLTAWISMAKTGVETAKEFNVIVDTFKSGELKDYTDYVDGKLEGTKEIELGDRLVDMYSVLEPDTSPEKIEAKVMSMGGADMSNLPLDPDVEALRKDS